MLLSSINNLLSFLTIFGQVFVLLALIYLLFYRQTKLKSVKYIIKNAIPLAWVIAFLATASSLYYSEIAGFAPCDLCWFQRIFMYPQVVLLGLAWIRKEVVIIYYSLSLLAIGIIFSVYHNYIYYTAQPSGFCSIVSPCTQSYVVGFSYNSIPLMAITAFAMVIVLLLLKRNDL